LVLPSRVYNTLDPCFYNEVITVLFTDKAEAERVNPRVTFPGTLRIREIILLAKHYDELYDV
jgi:hypothetical protein